MKTKMITAIAVFGATLLGQMHAGVGNIVVKVIQQENPFVSAEELDRFFQQLSGSQMLRFNFSEEEKKVITDFINYHLPGPSTSDTRAWASNPLWGGTISQIQTLLVERAKPLKAIFWSGKVNYSISGPTSFTGDTVPTIFQNKPLGNYSISYISGGPPNFSFVVSNGPQALQNEGQITFSLSFKTAVPEWRQVIETKPQQPTYGICPVKENVKDSLVVVTHGWQPAWEPVDIEWVNTMTNAITKYLENQGLAEWQVHGYRWVERAHTVLASSALGRAKTEGVSLGRYIVSQGFNHIHLIAHSAGAGLIQSASETIKTLRPDITVHLTFLDPFVGLVYEERNNYGKGADWTDNYFSHDLETLGETFLFTEAALKYGYNVEVTWLDTNRRKVEVSASTSGGEVSQTCYQIISSHGWPYEFYTSTIPPNNMPGSAGFGFPLSKEGGNWNLAVNQYKVGKNSLTVLGNGEFVSCVPNPSPSSLHIELPTDFSKLPGASVIMNSPGNVIIHGIDFELRTASPAWLAVAVTITNKVNMVSLEAKFSSASEAEGLLSVYWETNVIGSIDERMISSGIRQYTFPIPETATNGTRTVGFRLDAFSAIQSSVTITNVALGFAGMQEPFSLSFVGADTNGLPTLQLIGPAGFNYRVESSTNLSDWSTIVILVNTNGAVRFIDQTSTLRGNSGSATNATTRFYRAVAP